MKEVDWGSDLLLSCCFLLPVMSSNGIQLTTGVGKYVHGRGGCGCNGAVRACVYARVYPRYWSPFVKDGMCLFHYFASINHMFTLWPSFTKSLCDNGAKITQITRNSKLFLTSWSTTISRKHRKQLVILLTLKATNLSFTPSHPHHHRWAAGIKYAYIVPV